VQYEQEIRVLFIEDREEDAILAEYQLKRAGLNISTMRVDSANSLRTALSEHSWDIILGDYSLTDFNGIEALSIVLEHGKDIPFILVSGSVGEEKVAEAVRLGARDYILKDHIFRLPPAVIRELEDAKKRAEALELGEKLAKLKRFFPSSVAEGILSGGRIDPFEWHRKEVTVLFIDLRGFTSFVELAEPEDVVAILKDYYSQVAKCVFEFGGTIGHVAGDGIMMFFNDPVEVPNPQEKALRTGLRLREEMMSLRQKWKERDYSIDFGAGIASGFATVGGIGTEGCWDYSVVGTVSNLASRLCSKAKEGQILVPQQLMNKVSEIADLSPLGLQKLKGIHHPIFVYSVIGLRTSSQGDLGDTSKKDEITLVPA